MGLGASTTSACGACPQTHEEGAPARPLGPSAPFWKAVGAACKERRGWVVHESLCRTQEKIQHISHDCVKNRHRLSAIDCNLTTIWVFGSFGLTNVSAVQLLTAYKVKSSMWIGWGAQ